MDRSRSRASDDAEGVRGKGNVIQQACQAKQRIEKQEEGKG